MESYISLIRNYTRKGLNNYLKEKYTKRIGRSRIVYKLNDVVIKIERKYVSADTEYSFNVVEHTNYIKYTNKKPNFGKACIPVAKCVLVHTADNQPVLIMEYVHDLEDSLSNYNNESYWEREQAIKQQNKWLLQAEKEDGIQCGYNNAGALVMYDFTYPY